MPPGSGQGDGNVAFRVGENPDPVPRQGTLVVSDGSVELSQAAAPCAFTVSPNTDVVGAEGGTLSIDVRTNAACSWTASTDAPWATPSPETGKGTQTGTSRGRSQFGTRTGGTGDDRQPATHILATRSRACAAPPAPTPAPAPPPPVPTPAPPTPTPPVPAPPTPAPPAPAPPAPAPPTPSGTPAPTPPPPPPPAPKTVTLSGKIKSSSGVCPNVTYVLKEGTVVTTPATDFQKRSCDSIKSGDDIKVEGIEREGGIIRANVVTKK